MEEEIDLVKLIKNILENAKKYWVLMIVINLVCMSIAFALYNNTKTKYKSSAMIYYNSGELDKASVNQLFEFLSDRMLDGQFSVVSEALELNIGDPVLYSLKNIKSEFSEENKSSISISIVVDSVETIKIFEESLLKYLNNNEGVSDFRKMKLDKNMELNYAIDFQQNRLDSLWNNQVWSDKTNLSDIVLAALVLNEKKIANKYESKRIEKGFVYLQRFSKNNVRIDSPNSRKYVFVTILLSLAFCAFFLISLEFLKLFKNA